eukprot:CAMPEP_0197896230 /NCGR_PEP_ID=MMETSP1439-20131203/39386_1 /TAXON_ID=66791 /ORGANISM="Gonyaulax spinifera, Strain CCMP409" /LENGTH=101 /DNA_ID=CAMNT_0043516727 /DNA_START=317 /DNA_END=618 /DNA_ORIENTATION=-
MAQEPVAAYLQALQASAWLAKAPSSATSGAAPMGSGGAQPSGAFDEAFNEARLPRRPAAAGQGTEKASSRRAAALLAAIARGASFARGVMLREAAGAGPSR